MELKKMEEDIRVSYVSRCPLCGSEKVHIDEKAETLFQLSEEEFDMVLENIEEE